MIALWLWRLLNQSQRKSHGLRSVKLVIQMKHQWSVWTEHTLDFYRRGMTGFVLNLWLIAKLQNALLSEARSFISRKKAIFIDLQITQINTQT